MKTFFNGTDGLWSWLLVGAIELSWIPLFNTNLEAQSTDPPRYNMVVKDFQTGEKIEKEGTIFFQVGNTGKACSAWSKALINFSNAGNTLSVIINDNPTHPKKGHWIQFRNDLLARQKTLTQYTRKNCTR